MIERDRFPHHLVRACLGEGPTAAFWYRINEEKVEKMFEVKKEKD